MVKDDGSVILIDYEYSCNAARGFDIANHFCEWMADYHSDTPHVLDPTKYPTIREQENFIKAYSDNQDLLSQVNHHLLLSHLQWAIWGLIMAGIQFGVDFDYLSYSRQRLSLYFELKNKSPSSP